MKKQTVLRLILALAILLLVIQFFRPDANRTTTSSSAAIEKVYPVSEEVQGILKQSCYDCHSNNTTYPWYSNIQPLGWWLQNHIIEGKQELNFDEFGNYDQKKQKHKLQELIEVVDNGEMPLGSYTIIHRSARLSPDQKDKLISWAQNIRRM